jgi:hypothetical protein
VKKDKIDFVRGLGEPIWESTLIEKEKKSAGSFLQLLN